MSPQLDSDNPFKALEDAIHRQGAEEAALKAIAGARVRLIMGADARYAFFAVLALRFKVVIDWETETLAVDGHSLFTNPDFVKSLTPDELLGCVVHETLHAALQHHTRREGRNLRTWNVACDCAINHILIEAGFTLPKGRILAGEGSFHDLPVEKSAEFYYELLQKKEPEQEKDGSGKTDAGGCGEVRDAAESTESESEWKAAVHQAQEVSKGRGTLPGGLSRVVGDTLCPSVHWREVLREFVRSNEHNDYTWSRPNKRYLSSGLFLPSLRSEGLGDVVLAVDCSGSISEDQLNKFASEAEEILTCFDCSATILYHDVEVTGIDEWRPADGPLRLRAVGGGGTSHEGIFKWVEESGLNPSCLIALTDMDSSIPSVGPDFPVLWGVIGDSQNEPNFGQTVRIK